MKDIKIAIGGMACSGKTTVAGIMSKALEKQGYQVHIVKFADPIYAAQSALGKDKRRAFMQEFGDLAKKHFGQQVFVEAMKARIANLRVFDMPYAPQAVICDDLRFGYEMDALKTDGFKIIYVHSGLLARSRRAEIMGMDLGNNHNSEMDSKVVFLRSDITVRNDVSFVALKEHVEAVLRAFHEDARFPLD